MKNKFRNVIKLVNLLREEKIPFEFEECWDGFKISIEEIGVDAVLHNFSYGNEEGLLEIMGGLTKEEEKVNNVKGYLTAEEVFCRFKWCWEHKSNVFVDLDKYDSVFDARADFDLK